QNEYGAGGGGGGAGASFLDAAVLHGDFVSTTTSGNGVLQLQWHTDFEFAIDGLAEQSTAGVPSLFTVRVTDPFGAVVPDPTAFLTWNTPIGTDTWVPGGFVPSVMGYDTVRVYWSGILDPVVQGRTYVQPGPAALIAVSAFGPDLFAYTDIPLQAWSTDTYGNPIADVSAEVTWASSVGSDRITGNTLQATVAGPRTVTATADGLQAGSRQLVIAAQPIVSLTLTGPTQVVAGTPSWYTVEAKDANGDLVLPAPRVTMTSSVSADTIDGLVLVAAGTGPRTLTAVVTAQPSVGTQQQVTAVASALGIDESNTTPSTAPATVSQHGLAHTGTVPTALAVASAVGVMLLGGLLLASRSRRRAG
ncbi:MAG TPA: hypothetical protein VN200_11950, partial [Rhodoglobus sp.]|nr:hypothetical protein [Rhodoglobus sp.]